MFLNLFQPLDADRNQIMNIAYFSVTFVLLTKTSDQPPLANWTGTAICDWLLRIGTAQSKPGRDGWFAGSYIKGVLVKFGVIILGLGIFVGTHAVLDSA